MPVHPLLDIARRATREELLGQLQKEGDFSKLLDQADGNHPSQQACICIKLTNDRSGILSVRKTSDLSQQDKNTILELFEINMKEQYANSKSGYSPEDKQDELFDEETRFILVHDANQSKLLGFTSFRFDVEDTADDDTQVEVVYCYEVQISSEARGTGLGRLLMRCLETFARAYGLAKVMLTVFEGNTEARSFYKRINYESDEICPSNYDYTEEEEKPDYLILSRSIRSRSKRNKKKNKKKPITS